ncbi:hypothetical protein A45J_0109 [hot springs metagenome]|uniref:Uncharacterized protein n=1 Tax=hot springs metagenome TaxID=433727 RepID=A0A5J4KSY3_9ZZZZ
MAKRIISLGMLSIFVGIIFSNPAFSQQKIIDCNATLTAWRNDPRWRDYANTCSCPKDNEEPVCTGRTIVPRAGLHPSQQMAMGIVGAMISSVFSGMFDDLFAPPRPSSNEALIKKQQEEQWRKEQEAKRAAYNKWMSMQAEAEQKRMQEEAEKKRRGEEILAKASIGSGELKMESIGGGQLAPFNWDTPRLPATPATTGQYDTSKLSAMERLLCAASFSKMSENAAKSGDIEGVRFYGTQMDNVMQGYPTAIECNPPKELSSIKVDLKKLRELNQKYAEISTLYREVMPKIEKLQDIETRLDEVKKKKEDTGQKIKELEKQIEEIKAKSRQTDSPEKKAQDDDLLAQALVLKTESEKQYNEAIETEERLSKEKQSLKEEINAIKNIMQEGGKR